MSFLLDEVNRLRSRWVVVFGFAYCLFVGTVQSQWITQSITLKPGWNSVYLEVQPEPDDCDTVFANISVKSVWDYSKEFATIQFVDNPDDLLPTRPDWLVYFPPDSPDRSARNLFTLRAGRSYMIEYSGTENFLWQVKGVPRPERFPWVPDAFNLRGFSLSAEAPPTFTEFFAASEAHNDQPVYRLNNDTGAWDLVTDPASATMQRGEAYWVFSQGPSNYQGPLEIQLNFGDGIDFGNRLNEYRLRFTNLTQTPGTVSLRYLSSESVPVGAEEVPLLAGDVPLDYFKVDLENQEIGFFPLPEPLTVDTEPGVQRQVRFQVRRQDMTPFTVPEGGQALYQGLVEISNGAGIRQFFPVTAAGNNLITETTGTASVRAKNARIVAENDFLRRGLWAGTVVIDSVSEVENVRLVQAAFLDDFEDDLLTWSLTGLPEIVADPDSSRRSNVLFLHPAADGETKEVKRTAAAAITTPEFSFRIRNQDLNSGLKFQIFDENNTLLTHLSMAADGSFKTLKNLASGLEENLPIDTKYEPNTWHTVTLDRFLFDNGTFDITIDGEFKGTISFRDPSLSSVQGYAFRVENTSGAALADGGYIDDFFAFENAAAPDTPTPVDSEFQFRVIMHKDRNSQWKLLQQVYLMFKEGTLREEPPGSGLNVVDTPGEFVLVTDDDLLGQFSGSTVRDTDTVGRRLSSTNFGFDTPIAMNTRNAGDMFGLNCRVELPYNHPTNPFYHRYHPDHDNLDARFDQDLPEGQESFTVVRQLNFEFSNTDLDDLVLAGYGDTQIGGRFEETITGLHKEAIKCSGKFRISHVIATDILNDGLDAGGL